MRRLVLLLLLLGFIFSMSACGDSSDSKIVKQKLCDGIWVDTRSYPIMNTTSYYYYVYKFSEDGTFKYTYYDYWLSLKQYDYEGKYKIDTKKEQIQLTYAPLANGEVRDPESYSYYINEYSKNLIFAPNNNGESNYKNYPSLSYVYLPWE